MPKPAYQCLTGKLQDIRCLVTQTLPALLSNDIDSSGQNDDKIIKNAKFKCKIVNESYIISIFFSC